MLVFSLENYFFRSKFLISDSPLNCGYYMGILQLVFLSDIY